MHTPVLLNEALALLDPHPGDFVIDGTMDGGGHARAIMERISPGGEFLGIDLDEGMVRKMKEASPKFLVSSPLSHASFLHGNYADLPEILKKEKFGLADGLLLDLGFSSEQLALSGRGFSFAEASADEPLLMTYDDSRTPLWEILKSTSEADLAKIIFELGGERRSREVARAIKEQLRHRPIMTAGDLAKTIRLAMPRNYEHGRIDPATRTFQALRIHANGELENLSHVLKNVRMIVKPGGRVAIITFHSLEDGIVKRAFRAMVKDGSGELTTKKPIPASREEVRENPRSRSGKVRGIRVN